ncbi:hypothetical protein GJV85_05060 [Sulfurimonas aquatica]|uniref:Pilus assembly protein PilO n=1 Tax=Sulfurimonas aquatica TaxID=2672570 RepID=A0A975AZR7_9BACT|nr:hypothetical protein [Sulfurimonas aquatica]QSZ41500.1 hypothetical protein GJV85_05060 [Sulfurimonas aquatica]
MNISLPKVNLPKINLPKLNIEDYLHTIDGMFKDKTQKDIYMSYMMIVSLIFAFSYLLFWDSSLEGFEKTRKSVQSLQSKINIDNSFINKNPESKITELKKDISNINKEIIVHKDNNAYIKTKIETISSLIYDERTWGEYIHSISDNAQKNNVKLLNFQNKYASTENSFGHVLDISLKSSGSFKNTLHFINSLEQSELVVDIHSLHLSADKTLHSDLNISVWGITY